MPRHTAIKHFVSRREIAAIKRWLNAEDHPDGTIGEAASVEEWQIVIGVLKEVVCEFTHAARKRKPADAVGSAIKQSL